MTSFDPERVDLALLTAHLRATFVEAPEGPVAGRTMLRDAVAVHLACSALEAEQVVDTLIQRGFVRSETTPEGRSAWRFPARS
jgi:hypothetical protein